MKGGGARLVSRPLDPPLVSIISMSVCPYFPFSGSVMGYWFHLDVSEVISGINIESFLQLLDQISKEKKLTKISFHLFFLWSPQVYVLQVSWSDGVKHPIYRAYTTFFDLRVSPFCPLLQHWHHTRLKRKIMRGIEFSVLIPDLTLCHWCSIWDQHWKFQLL